MAKDIFLIPIPPQQLRSIQGWNAQPAHLAYRVGQGPHLFRAVRLRLRDHRLPRHTDIRGLLPLPAAPPLADPPFFAEDSIMFSRRIMQRRAACV